MKAGYNKIKYNKKYNLKNYNSFILQDLFSTFTIESVQETTLGANQLLKENKRMKWNLQMDNTIENEEESAQTVEITPSAINVIMKPMEIRTFILKVKRKRLQSSDEDI